VKGIVCDADDLSHWLTRYRDQLKSSASLSALPEVMHQQLAQFMVNTLNISDTKARPSDILFAKSKYRVVITLK